MPRHYYLDPGPRPMAPQPLDSPTFMHYARSDRRRVSIPVAVERRDKSRRKGDKRR